VLTPLAARICRRCFSGKQPRACTIKFAEHHVRFTLKSGHSQCKMECRLWAKSGLVNCSKHVGAEDCRTSLFACAYHNFSEVFSPQGISKRLRRPTEGEDPVDLRTQLVLLQCTKQVAEHCTGPDAHGM
jgi:hypothetical protein